MSLKSLISEYSITPKRRVPAFLRPIHVVLALLLTFSISTVSKAAQKVKRAVRAKKQSWKAAHAEHATARAWTYFRPAWKSARHARHQLPVAQIENLVDDPDKRVEYRFRVPRGLKKRVNFWIDVFSRFDSNYRIVHDRDNPELIYGYLDFTTINRTLPPVAARWRRREIERRVLVELKARIGEATGVSKPRRSRLSDDEKENIRGILSGYDFSNRYEVLRRLRRMRTQTGHRDHFLKALDRSVELLPQIEVLFRERGLPVSLARLPFVESAFNRWAVSKSGAIGIWQFMPETARRYDKTGTPRELSDPIRQSRSAARMLTILYERLGDWGLAVTAYNQGVLRVQRIAKQDKVDDIQEMIALPPKMGRLGFAGKNFYAELLAANLIERYKEKIFKGHRFQPRKMIAKKTSPAWGRASVVETYGPTRAFAPRKAMRIKPKHVGKRSKRHRRNR